MIFRGSQSFITEKSLFGSKRSHRLRQIYSGQHHVKMFEKWCKDEFGVELIESQKFRVSRNVGHSKVLFLKSLYELETEGDRLYSVLINQGSINHYNLETLINKNDDCLETLINKNDDWTIVASGGDKRHDETVVFENTIGNRLYVKNYASNLFDKNFINKILRKKDRASNKLLGLNFNNLIIDF